MVYFSIIVSFRKMIKFVEINLAYICHKFDYLLPLYVKNSQDKLF